MGPANKNQKNKSNKKSFKKIETPTLDVTPGPGIDLNSKKFKTKFYQKLVSRIKNKQKEKEVEINKPINNPTLDTEPIMTRQKMILDKFDNAFTKYIDNKITPDLITTGVNLSVAGAGKAYEMYNERYGNAKLLRNTDNFLNWAATQKSEEEDEIEKNKKFLKDTALFTAATAALGYTAGALLPSSWIYPAYKIGEYGLEIFKNRILS